MNAGANGAAMQPASVARVVARLRRAWEALRTRGPFGVWELFLGRRRGQTAILDGCRFGLKGIATEDIRIELSRNTYEEFERYAVRRYVSPDLPVIELGGCLGVVGCVTNKRLRDRAAHVVVEANPRAIPLLKRNRRRNRCKFQVLNRAVAYGTATVTFSPVEDLAGNSLRQRSGGPPVTVPSVQLGDIVRQQGFERFTLICDIEGHEFELVERESEILRRAETIIFETHARFIGEERNGQMLKRLEELGFRTVETQSFVVVLQR